MRSLSPDEVALVDRYIGADAAARMRHRFGHARRQTMLWRALQQTRPVETGLYTDRHGAPDNGVRRLHHNTASFWVKVFLDHLAAVDREASESEKEHVKHRIEQGVCGDESLASIFFEMKVFNAVDRSVARKVAFAEASGLPYDIHVETGAGAHAVECKSLRNEVQFANAWWHLAELLQLMLKAHKREIASSRTHVAVQVVNPGGLKNETARRSAAGALAGLLHAPARVEHPNLRVLSWEGAWATIEQATDRAFEAIERDRLLDPKRHFVYSVVPSYERPVSSVLLFVELEQKGLACRVADVCEEAARQVAGRLGPTLAVNLERSQMELGPTPAERFTPRAQVTADECWSAFRTARHFGRFAWMCVHQDFPPAPDGSRPGRIVNPAHLDTRPGGAAGLGCGPPPFGPRQRHWP